MLDEVGAPPSAPARAVAVAPRQPETAPYAAVPVSYAEALPYQPPPYTLDAGDKLRIVVFGQDGISNAYIVDAGGNVNLPLIGTVPARGVTRSNCRNASPRGSSKAMCASRT